MRSSYGASSETRKPYNALNTRYTKKDKESFIEPKLADPLKMFPYNIYQQNLLAA